MGRRRWPSGATTTRSTPESILLPLGAPNDLLLRRHSDLPHRGRDLRCAPYRGTVSWVPFTSHESTHFAELAELLGECRAAFRDLNIATQWRAAEGSPAKRDMKSLEERDPTVPEGYPLLPTQLAFVYLYAAAEQLGSLAPRGCT